MTEILKKVVVVDLSTEARWEWIGQMLRGLGAEVIRVLPASKHTETLSDHAIILDFESNEQDRTLLQQLISKSSLLLEDCGVERLNLLDLLPDSLNEQAFIHCSLTGVLEPCPLTLVANAQFVDEEGTSDLMTCMRMVLSIVAALARSQQEQTLQYLDFSNLPLLFAPQLDRQDSQMDLFDERTLAQASPNPLRMRNVLSEILGFDVSAVQTLQDIASA